MRRSTRWAKISASPSALVAASARARIPRKHPLVALLGDACKSWKQASEADMVERHSPLHLSQGTGLVELLSQQPPSDKVGRVVNCRYFSQTLSVGEATASPSASRGWSS